MVVVTSPRWRSPWPRGTVRTPWSRVTVESPPARVAGRFRPPRLLRGRRKDEGEMNIWTLVRREHVLAELPQVGARALSGFRLRWVWMGRRQHHTSKRLGRSPASGEACCFWGVPSPPPAPGCLAAGLGPGVGQSHSLPPLSVPEEGGRFARVHKDFNPVSPVLGRSARQAPWSSAKTPLKINEATAGVDFRMKRFEVLGIPSPSVCSSGILLDRRGSNALHQPTAEELKWLADTPMDNDPSSVLLFLVGPKKDLSTPAQYAVMEKEALEVAQEMKAEYWAVSSLTAVPNDPRPGTAPEHPSAPRVKTSRTSSSVWQIFEANVLAELEKSGAQRTGDVVRINSDDSNLCVTARKKKPTCCP
ncbi:LOW QUALITY PROTEIN: hypothetical protein MC885_001760 [Smutsia gigantea]|nr:LOW QUALITY PROTEIN: hypothetical protein MC885_001760 [Smutsia gigantea]